MLRTPRKLLAAALATLTPAGLLFAGSLLLPDAAAAQLAVAERSSGAVSFVDLAGNGAPVAVPVGPGPHLLAINPAGDVIATALYGVYPQRHDEPVTGRPPWVEVDSSAVAVLRRGADGSWTSETIEVCPRPHGVAFAGPLLLVTCEESGELAEVDLARRTVRRRIETRLAGIHTVVYDAATDVAWVASPEEGSVAAVDLASGRSERIITGDGAEAMLLLPRRRELWVANAVAGTITVLDLRRRIGLADLEGFDGFPIALAAAADGRTVWVAAVTGRTLRAVNAESRQRIDTFHLDDEPLNLLVEPRSGRLLVSLPRANAVAEIDPRTGETLRTHRVGSEVDGLALISGAAPALPARSAAVRPPGEGESPSRPDRPIEPPAPAPAPLPVAPERPAPAASEEPAPAESPAPAAPAEALDPDAALTALLADYVAFRDDESPLPVPEGTDPRYSDRLTAVSVEHFAERGRTLVGFRERLAPILAAMGAATVRGALAPDRRLDALLLDRELAVAGAEIAFGAYYLPFGSREGFHIGFAQMPDERPFRTVSDYDDYVARLQSFGEHTRRWIAILRQAIARGFVMPAELLAGYEATAAPHIVADVEASVFWPPLARLPESFPAADRARLSTDGRAAIRDSVVPAYRELHRFLVEEYIPAGRPTLAWTDLPKGQAFYEHRVRRYTTLDLSPGDVHELGLSEVARIRVEMEAVKERASFAGSLADFFVYLRDDPRFAAASEEDYLAAVGWAAKRMDGRLPELFGEVPRTPYGVRKIPDFIAPRMSAGYYSQGDLAEARAGWVNVNVSELPTRRLYVVESLAFHEGVPGHHFQIMLQRENPALSELRKDLSITAYVEGWGLYAERLGREAGFFTDPTSDFGRLTYEIWRAVRLVVDTGIHAFGWSREQAIDYMMANTGFAREAATAEIDRHITEPGQGLAYTVGLLEILELRRQAEEALGESFDLRAFHDAVLAEGSLTLPLLRERIAAFITAGGAPAPSAPGGSAR